MFWILIVAFNGTAQEKNHAHLSNNDNTHTYVERGSPCAVVSTEQIVDQE
jgi:hypothetical protein